MGVGGGEVGEDTLLSIEVHMTQECDLATWRNETVIPIPAGGIF